MAGKTGTHEGDVTDRNREAVRRELREGWSEDRLEIIDELYAEDVTVGTVRTGDDRAMASREDIKAVHAEWDEAFPDGSVAVNELVAEGDAVMVWWTIRGTHEGPFRGIEPTGNEIEVDGFSFRRFRDGRVVETKDMSSMATLLEQLGADLPV